MQNNCDPRFIERFPACVGRGLCEVSARVNVYKANAFVPDAKARVCAGAIQISQEGVRFQSPDATGLLPLSGLVVRRGGHNGEQIFFEHPEAPGWSIYCSDAALVSDPVLMSVPAFAQALRSAKRSRTATPAPVLFGIALLAVFLGGLVLLWMQKDRIAETVAERIPVSWEKQFGDRVFEQMEREGGMLTNSAWAPAVSNITSRLLPVAARSGYDFQFHIKQDTNVNAFAIPGGHVVILTGLLERVDSGEELAGVLAHEIAHVTRRHSLRNIIQSAGLLLLVQSLLGDASGLLGLAAEGSRFLLQQKFSRDFEREADDAGWSYLVEANIDPRGMTRFFERLKTLAADSGGGTVENSLSLVSTHPASQERIDRLNDKWSQSSKKSGFSDLGPWKKTSDRR